MASAARPRRFGLTREEARIRAAVLDGKTHTEITKRLHGHPTDVFCQIRAYLIRRSDEMDAENNAVQLLKLDPERNGMALIVLGPTIDKGPTAGHFHFDSGARLSFGLTLRVQGKGSELVSFRFHYQLPDGRSPEYLRFDLNEGLNEDSLKEPRCHFHPGIEDVRIPLSLHDPIEILDQVFFVLEANI
jgi:hypothetical protein